MKIPLVVLVIPTVVFGISLAQFNNGFLGVHAWFIDYSQHHFNFLVAVLSTVAALLGVLIAWVLIFREFPKNSWMIISFKKIEHILIRKVFFDVFYQFVIDKIILIVAIEPAKVLMILKLHFSFFRNMLSQWTSV